MNATQYILSRCPQDDEFTVLSLATHYDELDKAGQTCVHAYICGGVSADVPTLVRQLRAEEREASHE